MTQIHPTAIVEKGAWLDEDVEVGPYSIVGPHVKVGKGTWVGPHVVLRGRTEIGSGNKFFQFASVGEIPQDLKYKGEPTSLKIGNDNVFREGATVHIGTPGGRGITTIGHRNLFMACSHVAHDCEIESSVVLANSVALAGHVSIADHAILGGLCGIHQFVRIGESALIGAGSMVAMDIPPFMIAQGDRASLRGVNVIGLERRGFDSPSIEKIQKAYKLIFRSRLRLEEALKRVTEEVGDSQPVTFLVDFIRQSERGICR
ncbi:MAG: acyl-ACP--UDP-N-acetylglucosamine O-acyltransferase [Deltaproteobacteria bacterium]|nr:acyl-ACP--UDP-N-acetylglucosamine O-acyltransferase [Deltaproteobacteria bacterium]